MIVHKRICGCDNERGAHTAAESLTKNVGDTFRTQKVVFKSKSSKLNQQEFQAPLLLEEANKSKTTKAIFAWTLVFGHFRSLKRSLTSLRFFFFRTG